MDFQTPDWVGDIMVKLISGTPNTILEPTAGEGKLVQAIYRRYPKSIIYAPQKFEEFNLKVDYVVANPPYTPMQLGYDILERCFELSDNIIILMPWLAIINSEKRTKNYISHGLRKIVHLPRKAFEGSRIQTCILVFEKGYHGEIVFLAA